MIAVKDNGSVSTVDCIYTPGDVVYGLREDRPEDRPNPAFARLGLFLPLHCVVWFCDTSRMQEIRFANGDWAADSLLLSLDPVASGYLCPSLRQDLEIGLNILCGCKRQAMRMWIDQSPLDR